MKRSITTFLFIALTATAAMAQRTASATMQISATVVESTRLELSSSDDEIRVTSSSQSDVVFSVMQSQNTGNTSMTTLSATIPNTQSVEATYTLSSNETILSYGKTNPTHVKRITIDTAHMSSMPQTYIVSAFYN